MCVYVYAAEYESCREHTFVQEGRSERAHARAKMLERERERESKRGRAQGREIEYRERETSFCVGKHLGIQTK